MDDNRDYLKEYLEYRTALESRKNRNFAYKLFFMGLQFLAVIALLVVISVTAKSQDVRILAQIFLACLSIASFAMSNMPNKY